MYYCLDCEKPCEVVPERSDNGHEGHSYHAWTQYGCEFCGSGNLCRADDEERTLIDQSHFEEEHFRSICDD